MKWHKITEKLAPINKGVFILDKNLKRIKYATLKIYDKNIAEISDNEGKLKKDDIYWVSSMKPLIYNWYPIKSFPYWLEEKELIKLIADKTEKINRFEILDLRKDE